MFTNDFIPEGSLIEICPVIILPKEELPLIHSTKLHDYYFFWGWEDDQCAIALGFGSLYNHSYDPNARYWLDIENETIDFVAWRDIHSGEEILVNYNGDPEDQSPVWFEGRRSR